MILFAGARISWENRWSSQISQLLQYFHKAAKFASQILQTRAWAQCLHSAVICPLRWVVSLEAISIASKSHQIAICDSQSSQSSLCITCITLQSHQPSYSRHLQMRASFSLPVCVNFHASHFWPLLPVCVLCRLDCIDKALLAWRYPCRGRQHICCSCQEYTASWSGSFCSISASGKVFIPTILPVWPSLVCCQHSVHQVH